MSVNDNPWQHRPLLGNPPPQSTRGLVGSLFTALTTAVVLILGFSLSLMFIAVAAVVAVVGFSYLWWKGRTLREQLQARFNELSRQTSPSSPVFNDDQGTVVEGEVIGRHRE